MLDNDQAWSADHCADALEVPGVLFSNRPIVGQSPSLVDIAPSILAEFGLPTPSRMVGKNISEDVKKSNEPQRHREDTEISSNRRHFMPGGQETSSCRRG